MGTRFEQLPLARLTPAPNFVDARSTAPHVVDTTSIFKELYRNEYFVH
ncbi:hypothetical protein Spb1_18610 [Planctopirus ephydatiae]|uniref:Uncharacterized protein n=1 Tax=Planctopirus ephydatiae TaxID=2528019 RepID=A0A518GNB5_9PLAN|nr:hypothetical protein Spb1_18610 [Planctopirus ephydatiae]